jgi:site-specific DNA recombinase
MRLLLAARLSRLQANGEQGLGIETQDKRGKEWAERTTDPATGKPHVIVDVAADTKSGTVAPWDRPNLKPWVTDPALMAAYDGILAYENDRLSRGCWSDEARIRLWAEEHGKHLIIVDGPQWPPRHDGDRYQWEAMSMQARKEWEDIRERTMRATGELREAGKLTNRPPWGYKSFGEKYDHSMIPTELGREYIPEIFDRVIKCDSLGTIAAWLTSEGVPCSQADGKWWAKTVGFIVRNPAYQGFRCAQDPKTKKYGRVLFQCEPLVDAGIWRAANDALSTRPQRRHGGTVPANRAMLAGAIRCSMCNGPMYRTPAGTTKRVFYYRCAGRGAARKGCGNVVRVEAVDSAVNEIIAATFSTPVMVKHLIPGTDHSAELEAIRFEIKHLADRELPDDEHDAELTRLRAERDRLAALPKTEDRIELIPMKETYSQVWEALSAPERGAWLAAQGFTVTADKAALTVSQGSASVSVTLDG